MKELIVYGLWCIVVIYIAYIPQFLMDQRRNLIIMRLYRLLDQRLPIPIYEFSEEEKEMFERAIDTIGK